jgi:hypothetical protein
MADSRVGDLNRSLTGAPHVLSLRLNVVHDTIVYCQHYIISFFSFFLGTFFSLSFILVIFFLGEYFDLNII